MVAGVLRVIANTIIKMLLVVLLDLVGWVDLNPTTPHHNMGDDWLLAAGIGAVFSVATMAALEVLFRLQVRTHGLSLLFLPIASWATLVVLLVFVPQAISMPSTLALIVVGAVLSPSLPFKSRKDRQLVAITGEQPPIE